MRATHPAAGRRFSAWKNGGGETAEILCHPAGAGFDTFEWRISTARVARSGPFSVFEGTDRILTVLEGGGMTLATPGRECRLGPGSPPFAFAGDVPCHATLHGASLLDLNVMVRRPLQARVLPAGNVLPPARAAWLFALSSGNGLERHDLTTLDPQGGAVVPGGMLGIAIL